MKNHNSLPDIKIEMVEVYPTSLPFLDVKHYKCTAKYPDGSTSETFSHDVLTRKNIDAAVILAHEDTRIYLRSCVRPALFERDDCNQWELPAGLIEPGESPVDCACREAEEELGFSLKPENFKELGHYTFPSVGTIGERIYFFSVSVKAENRTEPSLDGSPLERHGIVEAFDIDQALVMIQKGQLRDAKTELGIWRFYHRYFSD